MGDDAEGLVRLAEFVSALRAEIQVAQASPADGDVRFHVGPVQVEFSVVTTKEGTGNAGIRFWVVEAGAGGRFAKETVQRITVELTPVDRAGNPIEISSRLRRRPD
jgi:hypothetical protein